MLLSCIWINVSSDNQFKEYSEANLFINFSYAYYKAILFYRGHFGSAIRILLQRVDKRMVSQFRLSHGIYMSHMGRACTNVCACLNSLINGFYCCDCIIFDVLFDKDII